MDSVTAIAMLKDLKLRADQQEEEGLQIYFTEAMGLYYTAHYRSAEMPALLHFEAALALALTYKYQELQAEIYHNIGLLYYRRNKFLQAFEALFKANGIIQYSIGYGRYPYSARYLYDLGLVYYDFGNYARAKGCLQDALYYTTSNTTRTIETYNTLGLTYRSVELYDSAACCFQKAITLASMLRHSAWVGITSGNLGRIFFIQKKYAAALPLLKADYELSIKNKEPVSAAATLCTLAEIKLIDNDYKGADEDLEQALALEAGEEKIDDRFMLQYTLVQASLCKKRKLFECAAVFLDSARILQSRITDRKNGILLAQVEKNMEVEKYLTDLKLMASEKSKAVLLRNFIIIISILLLLIAAQLMFRQQLKQKKNKEALNNAVYQLNLYIESLQEKNELIEQFQKEIESLHAMPDYSYMMKEKEEISDKLKKYTIVTEQHWNEFRHLFEKVQKGFFDTLKRKFPDLTQSEIRLLALIKLNLSKREMAEMLGVSPDSIKKTRQRIRKKIELPEEMDLEGLVVNI
jgi:tetratricopeptide (TPR) repeat protein